MDNPASATVTSLKLLDDWTPAFAVHADRFSRILLKHAKYTSEFADALNMYPAGSFELTVITEKLTKDLANLCEEFQDSMDSFQGDMQGLRDIFIMFHKEKEERENVSRPVIRHT